MKKILAAVGGTTAGLVLLLSSKAGHAPVLPVAAGAPASAGSSGAAAGSSGTAAGGSGSTTAGSGSASSGTGSTSGSGLPSSGSGSSSGTRTASRTEAGAAEDTRYGPVQVQITVVGTEITAVTALQLPQDDGRSVQISSVAGPMLASEAVAAQSAHIDTVSGATYTSDGYAASLQSAIDKAGL